MNLEIASKPICRLARSILRTGRQSDLAIRMADPLALDRWCVINTAVILSEIVTGTPIGQAVAIVGILIQLCDGFRKFMQLMKDADIVLLREEARDKMTDKKGF